ncbi:uncharacterized protein LOC133559917 isoform X1 [Nerophis ophidion]|uniref:uncharacterized protein LOC133559917 isoform X1 n=1 Tax=Nerophis ophidion TaxID=159077 RepID=UPI002ADFF1E4|nr:uncharacterized protein LOC133559917 isoform X1 [Nerophis ophidion]
MPRLMSEAIRHDNTSQSQVQGARRQDCMVFPVFAVCSAPQNAETISMWKDGADSGRGQTAVLTKMAARWRSMQQNGEAGNAWSDTAAIRVRCVHNTHALNPCIFCCSIKGEREEQSWQKEERKQLATTTTRATRSTLSEMSPRSRRSHRPPKVAPRRAERAGELEIGLTDCQDNMFIEMINLSQTRYDASCIDRHCNPHEDGWRPVTIVFSNSARFSIQKCYFSDSNRFCIHSIHRISAGSTPVC